MDITKPVTDECAFIEENAGFIFGNQKLSGKSYFPEFVDVDENQIEQWNHKTPPFKILESPRMDEEAHELCL
ncbi:hypothetical protein C5167_026325 [Papaver somniferum]|nr:hypothetical protein C5167_026325 [Papaver somniferum]